MLSRILFTMMLNFSLLLASFHISASSLNDKSELLSEQVKSSPVKAIGSATFSVLFWDIYQSRLASTTGDFYADRHNDEVLFEINYLRDIKRSELIERTVEQWQYVGFSPAQYQQYLPLLEQMWPDIKAGDTLALLVSPLESTFYFNNKKIGQIKQAAFASLFLDIWLSPITSQPALRQQLLGNTKA